MNSSPSELSGTVTAGDRIRQGVVLLAALAQVASSALLGRSVGGVARENASSILPAGYAFAIWGPIFALSLAVAIAGFVPSLTAHPAVRRSGWSIAIAFTADAVWAAVFPQGQFVLAQFVLIIGAVAAIRATVRFQRAADGNRLVTVLFGGTFGLLAGWLTAATFVGLANTLVSAGMSGTRGWPGVVGVVLLLVATGVAVAVVRACATGPLPGSLAYAAAVAWGLLAITVEQRSAVPLTAYTALGLAVVLLAYLAVIHRLRHRAVPIRRRRRPQRVPEPG
ncbi:hypothetical protein [Amycolatopsis magusensis]|uniref:Uncharacterized protein n=1 Tax=Amycolatopsis magusensis TaxID=882444 RepID=A0ABS4Q0N3_9PSEU|nr:hypothetical protein [Amycolatopsis magusensis]MBP2184406.1 hypothetical protein [Amycolatopsis magusensis]